MCAGCVARIIGSLFGKGLATSEGMQHALHKRLMKPAFNIRRIASEFYLYCHHILLIFVLPHRPS